MELQAATAMAVRLRALYAQLEERRYGRPWTTEEIALGFVGDVGDLAKLVQAHAGVRAIPDAQERLAHELSDCLWSILVLADRMDVDLESAFVKTMSDLTSHVERQLAE